MLQNTSIRRKQMLIIMLTTGVVLVLACAAISIFAVRDFRKDMVEDLSTLADIVGGNSAAALDFQDTNTATETLAALQAKPGIIGACIYTKAGAVFARYARADEDPVFVPPAIPVTNYSFAARRLSLSRPIAAKGDTIGAVYLVSDMRTLSSRLDRLAGIVGLVLLASLLLAYALSSRLQRLVSDPILHLAQVARSVALEKNYGLRARKQSNDELGQLVDGFNDMLAQIQVRDAALQTARESLETRVQARTAELAAANQSLTGEIAERKQAEEKLKLFRSLLDHTNDSIFVVDPDTGRFLDANQSACQALGYTRDELLALTVLDVTIGLDLAKMEAGNAMVEKEGHATLEARHRRKDGTTYPVEVSMSFVKLDQKFLVATVRDITQRKQFEARLFQSQKMETVGKLAGGIAHEFNSIMTAIIGQSELMLYDLPAGQPLRKNAVQIHQAADRAASLTRQLLAYGRKQILQPDILDLNTVLAGMDNTLRHLAGRDVDVRITPSAGPMLVKADPGQIEQVIVNIVMNAADAMPRGGKLTLETAEMVLDQEYVSHFPDLKAGDYVMLAITDTGAGMSDAVKARLFEPFFTTKDVGQGTGLGLATCHGILKQSGGHINVYSEPNRGATFKIYLPKVHLEDKPPTLPLQQSGLPRGTETILLVEDDPALREMAAELLGRLGYTILTAGNGLEALNVTHQRATGHIDLLFTDVVMPHMSGKELSDRIQALYPRTRILFTSAYTETAIVHQGVLNAGITLLQKPFTPSALAHKVREVLDQPGPP
jgi:two-component system cell cycle sensor histidine kinase/response regulator CckA